MMMKRIALSLLVASIAALSACGGRQGVSDASIEWQSAVQALPADASLALAFDPDEEEAAQLRSSFESLVEGSGDDAGAMMPFFLSAVSGFVDELAPFVVEHVDLEGDGALFVRNGALWLMATTNDGEAALNALAEEFEGDEGFERREVAGNPGFRAVNDEIALDVALSRNYFVVRFGGMVETSQSDREFVSLFRGAYPEGTLMTSPRGVTLESRLDVAAGEDISSLFYYDMAGIDALFSRVLGSNELPLPMQAPVDDSGESEGGASEAACADARDRIVSAMPWGGQIASRGDDGQQRSVAFGALSARAAERAQRVLRGAPEGIADLGVDGGLLGLGFNFDFGEFFETQTYSEELSSCRNIAMAAGLMARFGESMGHRIRFSARTLSGAFGLYLESVDLQGFVPTFDGAIVIGSPNPNALSTRLQRQLNELGEPTVVAEASRTTIVYQMQVPPVRLQLVELEDRVVISIGDVDQAAVQSLYSASIGGTGEPWMAVGISSRRLAETFRELGQYLDEMGGGDQDPMLGGPPPGDAARSAAESLERYGRIISRSRATDEGLESDGTTEP